MMSSNFTIQEKELYQRVDEIIHYLWDPIGVNDQPSGRNEYKSYLPVIFKMVCAKQPPQEIADHRKSLARDSMGCTVDQEKQERNLELAEIMLNYREEIFSRA